MTHPSLREIIPSAGRRNLLICLLDGAEGVPKRYRIRELSKITDYNGGNAHKIILAWVKQGLVIREEENFPEYVQPIPFYSINKKHPLFEALYKLINDSRV